MAPLIPPPPTDNAPATSAGESVPCVERLDSFALMLPPPDAASE